VLDFGVGGCCPSGPFNRGDSCNPPIQSDAMEASGTAAGPLTLAQVVNGRAVGLPDVRTIQDQLRQRRPVCCAVQWPGGGSHFVAVVGDAGGGNFYVADPWGSGTARRR
jgi:hypothetical protein